MSSPLEHFPIRGVNEGVNLPIVLKVGHPQNVTLPVHEAQRDISRRAYSSRTILQSDLPEPAIGEQPDDEQYNDQDCCNYLILMFHRSASLMFPYLSFSFVLSGVC